MHPSCLQLAVLLKQRVGYE